MASDFSMTELSPRECAKAGKVLGWLTTLNKDVEVTLVVRTTCVVYTFRSEKYEDYSIALDNAALVAMMDCSYFAECLDKHYKAARKEKHETVNLCADHQR